LLDIGMNAIDVVAVGVQDLEGELGGVVAGGRAHKRKAAQESQRFRLEKNWDRKTRAKSFHDVVNDGTLPSMLFRAVNARHQVAALPLKLEVARSMAAVSSPLWCCTRTPFMRWRKSSAVKAQLGGWPLGRELLP
jgi:hypothetical protein